MVGQLGFCISGAVEALHGLLCIAKKSIAKLSGFRKTDEIHIITFRLISKENDIFVSITN